MTRKKLQRFQELKTFNNVLEISQDGFKTLFNDFLKGGQRTMLEFGCGKGEYTIATAIVGKMTRCIGVDIQGERLWVGAKQAMEQKLDNVFFVRCYVLQLTDYIPENSIDEIWLPFSDPHPTKGGERKRLTSKLYHDFYRRILKPEGCVYFKTDDVSFYRYTRNGLRKNVAKLVKDEQLDRVDDAEKLSTSVETTYQRKNVTQSDKVYYLQWKYDI